jgi:hypothetical protein
MEYIFFNQDVQWYPDKVFMIIRQGALVLIIKCLSRFPINLSHGCHGQFRACTVEDPIAMLPQIPCNVPYMMSIYMYVTCRVIGVNKTYSTTFSYVYVYLYVY